MEAAVTIKTDVNNPDLGDMRLDDAGDAIVYATLADEVAQRLWVRFNFFLNEWFLDLSQGTPYFQVILVKAPTDRVIRTVLGNVIKTTEGVQELQKFSYAISRERRMTLNFECKLVDGTIFRTTDFAPFVIDINEDA